jgi:hypothetical protein
MYDILHELSIYKTHSTRAAEFISEELEVLQSNHNINKLKIVVFDLNILATERTPIINKLILEYCLYMRYLNDYDMSDNDIMYNFDDFINENNDVFVYAIYKDYRYKIIKKIKEVNRYLDALNINTLQFVGWLENDMHVDYSVGFITGYDDGEI